MWITDLAHPFDDAIPTWVGASDPPDVPFHLADQAGLFDSAEIAFWVPPPRSAQIDGGKHNLGAGLGRFLACNSF